ncbi:MAG: Uma2 family endonuclease [Cyanobacteria bacterium]|nr:Uma2 family endonuclease [Cyanobacteriota bacterium]
MSRPHKKITAAEFLTWPDDGRHQELIGGVHYVTPSPKFSHQEIVGRLYVAIANFLTTRRHLGRIILARFDVVLSDYDVVEPDLLFLAGDQQSILTEANVQGAPALVVEVLSPSTRRRDEGLKRKLFDEKGVREYWLVDPKHERVSVCRRAADGSFPVVSTLSAAADDHLESPLLPGFALSVSELFAELFRS